MKRWEKKGTTIQGTLVQTSRGQELHHLFPLDPLGSSIDILHMAGLIRYSVNICCLLRSDPKGRVGWYKENSTMSWEP